MFSALWASTTKGKRNVLRKFCKNASTIPREAIFFSVFLKQFFPAVISVRYPRTWRQKIWIIFFSFKQQLPFPKMRIFYPIFLQKSKKLDFSWKIFWRRKLPLKNRDVFFRIGVRSTNIRPGDFWNISKIAGFSIFPFFFTKHVTPPFSTHVPEMHVRRQLYSSCFRVRPL